MSYSEFLSKIIKESGHSLRNIATLCEKKCNVTISASYLSKLQKGGQTPASEKVNRAIAKVCRINAEDLIFEADLERAPQSVKDVINYLIKFEKDLLIDTINKIPFNNNEQSINVKQQLNHYLNMSNREFIKEILQKDNLDYKEFSNLKINSNDTTEKNTTNELFLKLSVGITMIDDSMFPTIKQGAKIELVKLDEYNNGDIIAVKLKDGNTIIRTYIEAGNNIVLLPENKDFETLTISKDDITIQGKIKTVTIEL